MKAKSVKNVRRLVRSAEFKEWRDRYAALLEEVERAHGRFEDPITHTVWRAGELDDASARAHTEFIELDDDFEALSSFEMQRQKASELWIELHKVEKVLEDHRQAASDLRQKIEARRKGRRMTSSVDEFQRRQSELGDLEAVIESAAREVEEIRTSFDEAVVQREELWAHVETEWTEAFRANMARAEYAYAARRVRQHAELVNQQPETPAEDEESGGDDEVQAIIDDLEGMIQELIQEAETEFGCILIAEFLYWPHQDDVRAALCVSLVEERHHLNLQINPLQVYEIERSKGIDFIAPVPEDDADADDPRLESFFLEDRPGVAAET